MLESDVLALIRTAMKERGISFKEALNSAVRGGLTQDKLNRRSFVQKSYSMGGQRGFQWDKALQTAHGVEDKELGRKLAVRK
jgi:hypothetical protein